MEKQEVLELVDHIMHMYASSYRTEAQKEVENWFNKKSNKFDEDIINAYKIIFEKFPELKALPVYQWGRYQRYELSGETFECRYGEYCNGFEIFNRDLDYKIDWKLIKNIDKYVKENNIEIEDNIDRDKCVEQYDGDDPGGSCLIIVKNDDCSFNIIPVSCDSPE